MQLHYSYQEPTSKRKEEEEKRLCSVSNHPYSISCLWVDKDGPEYFHPEYLDIYVERCGEGEIFKQELIKENLRNLNGSI